MANSRFCILTLSWKTTTKIDAHLRIFKARKIFKNVFEVLSYSARNSESIGAGLMKICPLTAEKQLHEDDMRHAHGDAS